MEVMFYMLPDNGRLELAFNISATCCDTGYGYFVQDEARFVCQHCKSVFQMRDLYVLSVLLDLECSESNDLCLEEVAGLNDVECNQSLCDLYQSCRPILISGWFCTICFSSRCIGMFRYFQDDWVWVDAQ